MVSIWKEVLCLGRNMDPKTGRWFEITPRKVADAHKNLQKMKSRGVPVPATWEHQDIEAEDAPLDADGIAEWKRNYARYTFGHISDSRINDRGNLDMLHDVRDDEDAHRLLKVKFVSPKIYPSYSDSGGGIYNGTTVAHVAATPTPVQHAQRPWELSDSQAIYMSYIPPDGDDPIQDRREEDEFETADTEDACPTYLEAFTDWLDGFALSATETEEGVTVAEEKAPPKKDSDSDDEGGGGMGGEIKALIKALKAKGMNISDKVSSLKELTIAVESNGGGDAAPMDETPAEEPPAEPENPDESGGTTAGGGPPMMMSTLDKNPARKKLALTEATKERKLMVDRVEAAFKTGRISRPERRALLRTPADTSIAMSFTATGDIAGKGWPEYLTKLDEIEKRPANSVLNPTGETAKGGLNLSTVDKPENAVRKEMTPERQNEVVDFIMGVTTPQAKK